MESTNGTARAVLAAGAMIAIAIYFKPNPEPLRFVPLEKVNGVRFDAVTGGTEVCHMEDGRLECNKIGEEK